MKPVTPVARPMSDLIHAHAGRPAVIMGGGVSMPEQVARAPANAVFISCNQHGAIFRKCDYIVATDSIEDKLFKTLAGHTLRLREFGIPVISVRRPLADYRIFKSPVNSTGVIGAWCAWVMGCAPILLMGMDCYGGGATYYHDKAARSSGNSQTVAHHLDKWRQLIPQVPGAMIRAMGGPLEKVFMPYDPDEVALPPAAFDVIRPRVKGERVRVVKGWKLPPWTFAVGEEIEVNHGELTRGLREKAIKRLHA